MHGQPRRIFHLVSHSFLCSSSGCRHLSMHCQPCRIRGFFFLCHSFLCSSGCRHFAMHCEPCRVIHLVSLWLLLLHSFLCSSDRRHRSMHCQPCRILDFFLSLWLRLSCDASRQINQMHFGAEAAGLQRRRIRHPRVFVVRLHTVERHLCV